MDDKLLDDFKALQNGDIGGRQVLNHITPLIYRGPAEVEAKMTVYSKFYYLAKDGIPSNKRSRYWSDILKVPIL